MKEQKFEKVIEWDETNQIMFWLNFLVNILIAIQFLALVFNPEKYSYIHVFVLVVLFTVFTKILINNYLECLEERKVYWRKI